MPTIATKSTRKKAAEHIYNLKPFAHNLVIPVSDEKPKMRDVADVFHYFSHDHSEARKLSTLLDKAIRNLPTKEINDYSRLSKGISVVNDILQKVDDLIIFSSMYDIDIPKAQVTVKTLHDVRDKLSYVSDYLLLAKEIAHARNEYKSSPKTYTFDELKKLIESK